MTRSPKYILETSARSVALQPGLSLEQLAGFQAELPGVVPDDIKELLAYSAGFDAPTARLMTSPHAGGTTEVRFTGNGDVALPSLPSPIALFGDGCGNFWVVDVSSSGAWGAVLFVCHDPPVLAVQAPDLASFLAQALEWPQHTSGGALDYVKETATYPIWGADPWLVSSQDARRATDPVLSDFANTLPDDFRVADLRAAEVGSGFSWGKAKDFDLRRRGEDLLFAVADKPENFLRRLFTRRT